MKNRGITLIALIITIIILLILAAIVIASLTGDNGILTRSSNAKNQTEKAKEDELRKLTALEAATNIENQPYTDKNGDTATIPAGFAVSQVEGENTIDDGLVIIDKSGNEFVWIPVIDYSDFSRKPGYANGKLQSLTNYGEANQDGINEYREETETTKLEAIEMYNSVERYKGFYIGRYETGLDNNDVVIKRGAKIYTNMSWCADGGPDGTDNKSGGALEISRNFDDIYMYSDVVTTLCYGVQWDAAISYIGEKYPDYAKESSGKGNYNSNSILSAGSSKDYGLRNIYDMAGNAIEWTMESYNKGSKSCRGSSYKNDGNQYPSSTRASLAPSLVNETVGFRITMFIV